MTDPEIRWWDDNSLEKQKVSKQMYCQQCGVKIGRNTANTEELGEVSHRVTDLCNIGVTDNTAPVPLREGTYGCTSSASNFFRNVQIVAKVHLIFFGQCVPRFVLLG